VQVPLKSVPIFADLNDSALAFIRNLFQKSVVAPGTVIVEEGEPGSRFYLVCEGKVRVCKNHGRPYQVILATLGPGSFFGEMCVLETLPRSATVESVDEVTLWSLSPADFYSFYEAKPDQYCLLVVAIARALSQRLRRLNDLFASAVQ